MPERFINWELLMNPANILIVGTMLAFVMIIVTVVYSTWRMP